LERRDLTKASFVFKPQEISLTGRKAEPEAIEKEYQVPSLKCERQAKGKRCQVQSGKGAKGKRQKKDNFLFFSCIIRRD